MDEKIEKNQNLKLEIEKLEGIEHSVKLAVSAHVVPFKVGRMA